MKKLIYILIFTLGIISCNSNDGTTINNSDLIGKWNWTNTDGGIAFQIHETPESTGKTIHLTLMSNYNFSIAENGIEISKGTYELAMKESIYSGEMERFITIETIDQQYVGFVKNGIVNIDQNQALQISDNNYDGIGSRFEKIE
jgi:hypothetical protein